MAYIDIKEGVAIIPDGTTEICDYAFAGCSELVSVVIPDSVTKIGYAAFAYCTKLNGIYCTSAKPPKISSSILSKYKVYVPIAAVETYMQARGWKKYNNNIVGYDFEKREVV